MARSSPAELRETRVPAPLALRKDARRPAPVDIPLPGGTTEASDLRRTGRRRIARWSLLLIALLGLGAGAAYWFLVPPSVAVVHPRRGMAVQAVYATGTVEPTVMVPIAPRTTARLVELDADEGSVVSKDQVLARLEDDDLRRAVDVAVAEERYAKAAFDRQAVLVERQAASRSAYDRAKADWEKARATAARAAAEAGFLTLVAPADGTVIRRDGEIGQMVGANQTVFWLRCCAPLRVSAEVDEEDIGQVRPGQQVLLRADAFTGQVFHGEVQAVTPKGDPVARSYRVRISLPADTPLMIGMTTETNIVLRQSESALLLPAKAVQQDAVWRVKDGQLARQHVTIGAKGASEVEIVDGIADGDWIVADPVPSLTAGQPVRLAPIAGQR
jgi:membrane fusion protein, multidrug efflux system